MDETKKALYLILILTLSTKSSTSQPEGRALQCTAKSSNSKVELTCSGYPSIPTDITTTEYESSEILVLDLSGNHLQTIKTAEFSSAGFRNLDFIKLSNNQIRTIDRGAFRGLNLLTMIDLSANKIDSLDMEIFETNENDKLQILKLNGNPIHQFKGEMFPPLPSLKKLYLNDCRITKIPTEAFSQLGKLQELFLGGNQIKRMDRDIFKTSHSLYQISLSDNPWYCDCHVKFLKEYLEDKKITFLSSETQCAGPESIKNKYWKEIDLNELTCHPKITELTLIGQKKNDNNDSLIGEKGVIYSEIGKELAFECVIEAYPPPEVKWLKDNKEIVDDGTVARGLEESEGVTNDPSSILGRSGTQIKFEEKLRSNTYEKYNYKHTKILRIYQAELKNLGEYTCYGKNKVGSDATKVFLNFTNIPLEPEYLGPPLVTGGSKWWIWIVVTLLILILIASLIICFGIWKRRERKRQKTLKGKMMEKFKDSQIILDEADLQPKRPQTLTIKSNGSSVPLLSPSQPQPQPPNQIPDVAKGKPEYVRSLSPEVFSPRPTPSSADLRNQFFARQMSQSQFPLPVTSSRPGSALSVYYDPNNRRQLQAMNQQYPNSLDRQYPMYRPGSAMSLAYPDQSYHAPRPVLTRQYSGPAYATYATMSRLPPRDRRPPSISSFTSEPPLDRMRLGLGYVTLPRGFAPPRVDSGFGRSTSPTESAYSTASYSTLPRRARIDPATGVVYDNIGPRTTVDGGSTLSLNRIGEPSIMNSLESINYGLNTPTKGKVKSTRNRSGSSTTPGSIRGRNDFFSFEPIQEVEGSDDVLAKQSSNNKIDDILPKMQNIQNAYEPRFKKKRPPPMVSIPPKSRKPIRTFEYAKIGEGKGEKNHVEGNLEPKEQVSSPDVSLNSYSHNNSDVVPQLPTSPPPKPQRLPGSLENIYDLKPKIIPIAEGTEV